MTRIIYTTVEDFIKQEVDENSYDYVEAQFALGYEPALVTVGGESFYTWALTRQGQSNVLRTIQTDTNTGNIRSCNLPSNSIRVPSR